MEAKPSPARARAFYRRKHGNAGCRAPLRKFKLRLVDPTSPASSALSETAGCFDQAHHARTRSAAAVICPAMRSRPFFISCGSVGNLPRDRFTHDCLLSQRVRSLGCYFPGGGESPTFPQVRLGCPSLWSAISDISALAGRVTGSGLWWRFSYFRFGGAETGSTADREPSTSATNVSFLS